MQRRVLRGIRKTIEAISIFALTFFVFGSAQAQEIVEIELLDATPTIELLGAGMNTILAVYDEDIVYDTDTQTLEVVWKTSEATDGAVLIDTASHIPNLIDTDTFGYAKKHVAVDGDTIDHHIAVSGLSPNTTYYVRTMSNSGESVPSFGREYTVYSGPGNGVSCEYLGSTLGAGKQNDTGEVIKLQSYLAAFEGAALPVSGIYDAATIQAVNAFQAKYAEQVLAPWGLSTPTGFVGITTKNAINDIYCGREIALGEAELAEIEEMLIEATIAYVVPEEPVTEDVVAIDEEEYVDESIALYEDDVTIEATTTDEEPAKVVTGPEVTVEPIATSVPEVIATTTEDDNPPVLAEATTTDVAAEEERDDPLLLGKYQAVGPAMGSTEGVKQLAAITVGYIDQYSLPILIVLVILLIVQLVLLWRTPVEEDEDLLRKDF